MGKSTTINPVTHTADVEMNRAVRYSASPPVRLHGSISRRDPTIITTAKLNTRSVWGETTRKRRLSPPLCAKVVFPVVCSPQYAWKVSLPFTADQCKTTDRERRAGKVSPGALSHRGLAFAYLAAVQAERLPLGLDVLPYQHGRLLWIGLQGKGGAHVLRQAFRQQRHHVHASGDGRHDTQMGCDT